MAIFRVEYTRTEYRHCYFEADADAAARRSFEAGGPETAIDDRFDDMDQSITEIRPATEQEIEDDDGVVA